MHHVVAVADERDAEAVEPAAPLEQREAIGEHLAGMVADRRAPLMTGTVRIGGELARTVSCENVRATTRSTQRERLRAMSPTDSRSPSRMSPGAR